MTMAITPTALATGPANEFMIVVSGASHGIAVPLDDAQAEGSATIVSSATLRPNKPRTSKQGQPYSDDRSCSFRS